jgi:DNA-binding NtrC family response regulator
VSIYRILIADDEAQQREMLAGFFQKRGHEIKEASNGVEALEIVKSEPVDLVLTDMRMPGLNGIELLQLVREVNQYIEVIVITAFGTIKTAVEAMQKGAFTFVTKPVDLGSLAIHIERAMERKLLHFEKERLKEERENLIAELHEAIEKIKVLDGLVPICANCKKIRDDKGYWNQIEQYITKHSSAKFTHGICPECVDKLYPGLINNKSGRN